MLRNKAALRNPDEFYFAMQNERTRDGVHVAKCVVTLSSETPAPSVLTHGTRFRSSQQKTYTHDELQLMKVKAGPGNYCQQLFLTWRRFLTG